MRRVPTSRSHPLGLAAFVVCLVALPGWLLARSFAPPADRSPIVDEAPSARAAPAPAAPGTAPAEDVLPVDVTAERGCGAGDLPGFTVPRWITVSAGYARPQGDAYLQCQINRWPDDARADADFEQRVQLLDAVVAYTADRAPAQRTERLVSFDDGPELRSYADRSPTAATKFTWVSVVRHGPYAGVVTLHSYVEPGPVDRAGYEGLVATVRQRMAR
jgi:hypothetical protein